MSLLEFYLWGVAISLFSGWMGYNNGYACAKKEMLAASKERSRK